MKIYCVDVHEDAGGAGSGRSMTFHPSKSAAARAAREADGWEHTYAVYTHCLEVPADKRGLIEFLNNFMRHNG
jgi:hypothetical protein